MSDLTTMFTEASRDRRHGASEIELRLIDELLRSRESWNLEILGRGADHLLAGQPTMANLRNLARRLATDDLSGFETWLRHRHNTLTMLSDRLADVAWSWLRYARRVVTISRSSAVAAVLEQGHRRGWRGETVVLDGGPAGGGVDQAARLSAAIGRVRSQPDATASLWLEGDRVTVVVGADAVSRKRIINACGTSVLLELAASRSIPVVVVADTGKDLPDGELDELLAAGPTATEPGPDRRWPVFEAVSRRLVTDRIHE